MESKTVIWVGMTVGSLVGSFVPDLWGASVLSISSLFFSAIGGIIGIYLGWRMSN